MSRQGGTRGGGSRGGPGKTPKKQTPGTSGTRQSRAGSIASGLTPLSEGDSETLGTELSAFIPRATYKPPNGYYSPTLGRFQKYLEDTQVEVLFRKLLRVLLNRPELPYNPYPGFYGRLRVQQENFHLESTPTYKIVASLKNPLKDTYIQNLYTIKYYDNIWGLSSILRVINPDALVKYRWLINNVTPRLDELPTSEEYSNQVMVALVGPCIFDGSLYPACHHIQVRLEYLVTGPDVTQGISIFVNSIMKEIDEMFNSEHHFLLGVNVPSVSSVNQELWVKHYWEPDKIQAEKETFLQKLSDAVIGMRYIHVECIFLLNPSYPSYVRGEKQYGFNFIEVLQEMREEGLESFCEYPLALLHEGVFFERSQAEAYVSMYQVQIGDFENVEPMEAGEGAPPASPGITSQHLGSRAPTRQSRMETARSTNRRFSMSQEQNVSNVQQHVHKRLDQIRPRRVKIDGFRFSDERSTGPFAWQFTTPIKSNYQKKIASYWRDVELFEIVYCILMLVLMDREAFEDDILVEIYKLLHGTAGRLYLLMEHNKGLRAIIQALANTRDYPVMKPLLLQYKDSVEDLFLNPLLERSQDHVTVGRSITSKLEDMVYSKDMEFASATHLQFTLRGLKNINLYCIPLVMELAEDSLSKTPQVSKLINTMEDTFPEEDPRPPTRYKKRVAATSFQAGEQEEVEDDIIKHGVEDEHIKRHETSVLNVKTCMGKDLSPHTMVKENVLMKYMLDCHIDEMWSDYMIDLAGGDIYPPNAFPRLISILRQCAMRMDLFYEKPSTVTEKMFNLEVKLEDKDNYVYHIPGVDAHGSLTSLMMLDTGVYITISQIIHSFQQKSYIQKKGPYRVGICLALSGPSIWYGRLQPYLNEIELHEHYYIQGPSGCQGEAIQLCAVIAHSHMVDMITKSGLPVMGVYFGSPSPDHWTCEDVLTKKRGFLTEFSRICGLKQHIYAKAYVILDGWRYVTLTKYFKLHFLENGIKAQTYFPHNPSLFYQSVFLSKDRAAFYYQNTGPPQGGDPMSMANVRVVTNYLEKDMHESQRKCDWLNFYRHLLLRDLISQDQTHVADCWRILHSMAGQVEYIIGMMEVLQDLVITCLQSAAEERNRQQNSRQASRQSTQSGRHKNPVDSKNLTKMVMAFYQKLMYVCEARLTMAARSLTDYIENKLKSALEFDPETGQPYLAIEDQTIFRLEEMKSLMKIFQDTLSGDVRSVCDDVTIKYQPPPLRTPQMTVGDKTQRAPPSAASQQYNRGVSRPDPYLAEPEVYHPPSRPVSVVSSMLDDPDFYRSRPTNLMSITE